MERWDENFGDIFAEPNPFKGPDSTPGNGRRILNRIQKSTSIGKFDANSPEHLFEEESITYIDDLEGPGTLETHKVYKAGCGHLVGVGQVAPGGICGTCGQLICSSCADSRCERCNALLCKKCVTVIDELVFCSKCNPSYRREKALKSFFKIVGKSFLALHHIFSKEF